MAQDRPPTSANEDLRAAVERVLPLVRKLGPESERLRHMHPELSEQLAREGLLQLMLPRGLGGKQHTPLEAYGPVEAISAADGSVGWCVMIASLITCFSGWLPPEVGRASAGTPADLRMAGSIRPQGRARKVPGGYRIDGHWDFASGIHYARWMLCPCVIFDGDQPLKTPAGGPLTRTMWIPSSDMTIVENWDVIGLRGTGSHDFVVKDVFVPESHTLSLADPQTHPGALYIGRLFLSWAWTTTVAHSMGIARGAIDTFVDIATAKGSTTSPTLLRDRPMVQSKLGEAAATLGSARAYVFDSIGKLWDKADRGLGYEAELLDARLALVHSMHASARAVDLVYHAAGTNGVYAKNAMERHFRDIHVAIQHGAALPQHFESAGKVMMGLRPTDPGW